MLIKRITPAEALAAVERVLVLSQDERLEIMFELEAAAMTGYTSKLGAEEGGSNESLLL